MSKQMGHIEGQVQHQELLFPEVLGVLTYNLKRVINILGVRSLLERLKAVAAHFRPSRM